MEGAAPEYCRRYVEQELKNPAVRRRGRSPFPFGQYTDDSQLARELLQSYVTCGRFEPQDYANRIAAIFKEGRIVGRGRATTEAAQRLAEGTPWEKAGTLPPSAGNGSAMRAGPIGLVFADEPEKLVQAADDQGRITHRDTRCSAGAVAIAGAVALALRPSPVDIETWVFQLSEWVRAVNAPFAENVLALKEWVHLSPEEVVDPISGCGLMPGFHDQWEGISPFVIGSVLWSLYSFLRTPDDYWETICTAIAVGGDVDTTAAMAGAISGAHVGLDRLPMELASRLTDQGSWEFTELVQLAHRCHAVKYGRLSV